MEQTPIFGFSDLKTYLNFALNQKKQRNKRFSIRAWSKKVGLKNPSLLLNVLKGERKISVEFGNKILPTLELKEDETKYFEILVLANLAKSQRELDLYAELLEQTKPDCNRSDLSPTHFKHIANWYHLVILEMFSLKNFQFDVKYIQAHLRKEISESDIQDSIDNLVKLGFLSKNGNLYERSKSNPVLKDEIPSQAVKLHHHQMLLRAIEAITGQDIHERDLRSTKLGFRNENFSKVKETIREFHRRIQKLSTSKNSDHIFAFNSQFFKLTKG